MDQSILSSRAVIGLYYAALENPMAAGWIDGVSNLYGSDQASEQYVFLGQNPRFREWIGGRQAKGLRGNSLTISNKHYEATLEILLRDLRRDKTPQLRARIGEFAQEGNAHWSALVSTLIQNGASALCYDGQYYFDTDHIEGDSGQQDNDISVDISTVPGAGSDNTPAFPNAAQMQAAIMKAIAQIMSFKDDQGRQMNSAARQFVVTVPTGLYMPALSSLSSVHLAALQQNINPAQLPGFKVNVEVIPELTWTDSFAVWRTDSAIKGLIRQSETEPTVKMKDENSDFAFDNDAIQLGVDAWRGADYGLWQRSCYVTMV